MKMRRRAFAGTVSVLGLAALSSCGGGGGGGGGQGADGGGTTASVGTPSAAQLKLAYDAATDTTVLWNEDGSLLLSGSGQISAPGFAFTGGQVSDGTSTASLGIVGTVATLTSADGRQQIVADSTDPQLTVLSFLQDGVLQRRAGTYTEGGKRFVGDLPNTGPATRAALSNVREAGSAAVTVARNRHREPSLLARLVHGMVPSAHADSVDDLGKGIVKEALTKLLPFGIAAAAFVLCAPGGLGLQVVCAVGAFTITGSIFGAATASASEIPSSAAQRPRIVAVASSTCSFACFSGVYVFLTAGPDWIVESADTRFVGQTVTVPATSGGACPTSGIEMNPIDLPFTGEAGVVGRSLRGWAPHFPAGGWNNSLPSFTPPANAMLVGRVGETSYPPCSFKDEWDTEYSVAFKNVATGERVVLAR